MSQPSVTAETIRLITQFSHGAEFLATATELHAAGAYVVEVSTDHGQPP